MGGPIYRFTRMKMHHHCYIFGQNISQLKKGKPLVSDLAVERGVAKTVKALSTHQQPNRGLFLRCEPWTECNQEIEEVNNSLTLLTMIEQCRRTSREIYSPGWYKPQKCFVPSISGHFLTKRHETGALGAIVKQRDSTTEQLLYTNCPCPKTINSQFKNISSAKKRALEIILSKQICFSCLTPCTERFCVKCGWEPFDSMITINPAIELGDLIMESVRYDDGSTACKLNMVRPVGLKEPFKVRVITGGPEGKYYRTKYIQKATHGHLRQKSYASLIGETITAERLNSVLWTPKSDEHYISGDYSAATDNLDPEVSNAICDEISRSANWHTDFKTLYEDSLTKHRIYHGSKKIKPEELDEKGLLDNSSPQKWGQLMGSPTSFPVLCIANLAITRYCLEVTYGRSFTLEQTGILINGDDIGFVINATGYELWKRMTSTVGLTPSMGKNFCSEDFIVLNSTFYNISTNEGVRSLVEQPYINYGLLQCRNENGTPITDPSQVLLPSQDPRTPSIGDLARALIRGHSEPLQIILLKRFVKNWSPFLQRFCPRGMSYWAPTHLGGLGLPIIGEFKSKDGKERFSRCQRVLAAHLSLDPQTQADLKPCDAGRSESFSLWKKIADPLEKLLCAQQFSWTKEKTLSPQLVTTPLLANAYARLHGRDLDTDLESDPDSEVLEWNENRYQSWKLNYEAIFDEIKSSSTATPMTDAEILVDIPWNKQYNPFVVVNYSPQVDLCKAFSECVTWVTPSIETSIHWNVSPQMLCNVF